MKYLIFEGTDWIFPNYHPTEIVSNFINRLYRDMTSEESMGYYITELGDEDYATQLAFVESLIAATARFGEESFRSELSEATDHLVAQLSTENNLAWTFVQFLGNFANTLVNTIRGDRAYYNVTNLYTLKELERQLKAHFPPGDDHLVEINKQILDMGQSSHLYGPSWNREDFGIRKDGIPFAKRLDWGDALRYWPQALMHALVIWQRKRDSNDMGENVLREFWESDYVPPALRKQRGWFIDPIERVLVGPNGQRLSINPDFDLENRPTGKNAEYIFDHRARVLIGPGRFYIFKDELQMQ